MSSSPKERSCKRRWRSWVRRSTSSAQRTDQTPNTATHVLSTPVSSDAQVPVTERNRKLDEPVCPIAVEDLLRPLSVGETLQRLCGQVAVEGFGGCGLAPTQSLDEGVRILFMDVIR